MKNKYLAIDESKGVSFNHFTDEIFTAVASDNLDDLLRYSGLKPKLKDGRIDISDFLGSREFKYVLFSPLQRKIFGTKVYRAVAYSLLINHFNPQLVLIDGQIDELEKEVLIKLLSKAQESQITALSPRTKYDFVDFMRQNEKKLQSEHPITYPHISPRIVFMNKGDQLYGLVHDADAVARELKRRFEETYRIGTSNNYLSNLISPNAENYTEIIATYSQYNSKPKNVHGNRETYQRSKGYVDRRVIDRRGRRR